MTRRDVVRTSVIAGAGITLAGVGTFWLPERRAAARQDGNYTIAFIQGVIGDNFYITMDCGARARAEALGATIETQGPEKFDQTLQTPILNAVVQSGPDAIMMAPNDSQGMIAPIQAALDAGIPVFCVDTTINSDIQLADVSTDNVEGGRLAARGLAEAIGEQGKVFVINVTPGISTTDQRQQGFEEEIANYPEIEYLGSEYSNNDATGPPRSRPPASSRTPIWPASSAPTCSRPRAEPPASARPASRGSSRWSVSTPARPRSKTSAPR
jgi:ribose transport system substrate-binding protein